VPQTFCTKCGYDLYSLGLDSEGMAKCPECGVRGRPSPWKPARLRGHWAFPILAVIAQFPPVVVCWAIFGGLRPKDPQAKGFLLFVALVYGIPLSVLLSLLLVVFPGMLLRWLIRASWSQYGVGVALGVALSLFLAFVILVGAMSQMT